MGTFLSRFNTVKDLACEGPCNVKELAQCRVCFHWHLQCVRSILVDSERVLDGSCGGFEYRLDSFGCEFRRICQSLRDRECQPENRQFVLWFGAYGSIPIPVRSTRLVSTETLSRWLTRMPGLACGTKLRRVPHTERELSTLRPRIEFFPRECPHCPGLPVKD